ncbi:Transcriptional regulatory protein OmpR [Andreprevotia sp. IGB-42]|uniref:response regulator transcription factor n=1 Tax=Andreprevotia sp. IGB-42 TaxID=2497473 RepID=UPI0013586134|nr:response regulator transcription factor [Andreprevotia sp. IGB-42]KAF0812968.1 Transcriptional regulatory protein OmpR [Andreprevotia sp. IGB-42]
MAKILLVEDDRKLSALIREYLGEHGFVVDCVYRGDEVLAHVARRPPDLLILDVMLPGCDGFAVCKQLRSQSGIPILMLTARGENVDEVIGLELGADDYVVKPVQPRVLLARINALLRRPHVAAPSSTAPVSIGPLRIDRAARQAFLPQGELILTTSEFELLCLLVERMGSVVSRDDILLRLRGIDFDGFDRSADVFVSRLRRKLASSLLQIKTVWGRGYMFIQQAG